MFLRYVKHFDLNILKLADNLILHEWLINDRIIISIFIIITRFESTNNIHIHKLIN